MKASVKRTITLVLVLTLLVVTVSSVFAATIRSTRFWLSGWNGPLYLDVNAKCSGLTAIDIEGSAKDPVRSKPLDGTWRVKLPLRPEKTYVAHVICQDNTGHGVDWVYRVWFKNATIRVKRLRIQSW